MTETSAAVIVKRSAPRLRRTILLTPGNRAERLAKAASLNVDAVAFDLEDGVGPEQKADARRIVAEQLAAIDFGHRERVVRVNAITTPEFTRDLAALPFERLETLFIPKVETAEELERLDIQLDEIEQRTGRRTPVDIIATIETPRGLLNALPIVDASRRVSALFFGSGDYSAATGGAVTERALAFPRATIVAAASAAGIQPIDAAYFVAVKDAAATAADAEIAKELGFVGKVIFHPNQIAPCNAVFSPTDAEIARARRIVEAHAAAQAEGKGVAYVDGEFLAIDIVMMAQRILDRAEQVRERTSAS